jgi:acyl-CoA dehydrogenase
MRRTVYQAEHEAFRQTVRGFITDAVEPEYPEWERSGRPSQSFWRAAATAGILGIRVPREYGGNPDATFLHSAVVTEEIQRRFLALGGLRIHTDICMPYLLEYATPNQMATWLPRLTAGDAVVALGLSEPGAGSDMASMTTRAVRDGDHFVVNGAKTFISNGGAADLVILAVKTDPEAGRRGISLLLVDAATPGFERGRSLHKLGLDSQDLAELSFTDMRVPVEDLLGDENDGFEYLSANLAQERLSIAVNSQAAAAAITEFTVDALAGTRPRQSVKFELATAANEVAAGQALLDQALSALMNDSLTPVDAAHVKLYCTELQSRTAERCLRIFGPDGFARDAMAGRSVLDGRVSRIYGGSSEIMRVIIAKSLGL